MELLALQEKAGVRSYHSLGRKDGLPLWQAWNGSTYGGRRGQLSTRVLPEACYVESISLLIHFLRRTSRVTFLTKSKIVSGRKRIPYQPIAACVTCMWKP